MFLKVHPSAIWSFTSGISSQDTGIGFRTQKPFLYFLMKLRVKAGLVDPEPCLTYAAIGPGYWGTSHHAISSSLASVLLSMCLHASAACHFVYFLLSCFVYGLFMLCFFGSSGGFFLLKQSFSLTLLPSASSLILGVFSNIVGPWDKMFSRCSWALVLYLHDTELTLNWTALVLEFILVT